MAPTKSAASKPAAAAKKASAHPTFLAMIQECVAADTTATRQGVSRPAIKKYLADKHKLDMSSASNLNNLNNAIKRGADSGALVLPKGAGGKVKLASKAKPAADKENVAPKKAAAPAKKAAPAPAKKAAAAPAKKAAAPAAKKAAAAPKAAAKKAAAPAKKAAAAPKKKASTATTAAKKTAAKPKKAAPAPAPAAKPAAPRKAPAVRKTKA